MKNRIFARVLSATLIISGGIVSCSMAQPDPSPNVPQNPAVRQVQGATGETPVIPGPFQRAGTLLRLAQQQTPEPPANEEPAAPATPPPRVAPPPVAPERKLLPSPAPAASAPSGGMISLNFTRADLVEIVHIIAQHLRLTYTIDPEVKGTVTIHSPQPLSSEDLLPIFHQVLRMNGAVAVRSGNLYRIVPIKDAKSIARPAGQNREDSFALQIVPVRYFTVGEMKRLLSPFLMAGGEIIENPRGNFLIIIDLPSNIQRLVEIAELIDAQVFAGMRMEIYQPKVASAEELAQEMTKLMQSFAASAPQQETLTAQFLPLPRINQLLIISHSDAAWTYAKRWLDRIDVVAEGPGRRIFIYPVENSKAADLAEVLGQALGLPTSTAKPTTPSLQSLHRASPGGTGTGLGTGTGFGGTGTGFGGSGMRSTSPTGGFGSTSSFGSGFAAVPTPGQPPPQPTPSTPAPAPPPPGQPPRPSAPPPGGPGGPQQPKPEEQLRIVADPGTNSLIIYGTAQEFQNIKNILKDLDTVPRQVLMDVLIAEVQLNNDETFGVDYEIAGGPVTFLGRTFGSRGSVLTGILSQTAAPGTGSIISGFPQGITGIIGNSQTVRALINALQSDSRVRILSSPSVLASDNRPARIQVGTEEPIATGQIIAATGAANPSSSTTIQYRNTGRIVTIVPQVNSQGLVNLQILAEVSQRGLNVTVGTDSFPAFDIRQAETTAVVQNSETLVIGGIIADNRSRDRTGIPYLMDVPVFGRFFGTTTDRVRRTELIMLITPNVIRNREESRDITEEFKAKVSAAKREVERMRREQEQKVDELRKNPPEPPTDTIPEQPDAGTPAQEGAAKGQQSPAPKKAPEAKAAPAATSTKPPARSSHAAQQQQSAPVRQPIEIRLHGRQEPPGGRSGTNAAAEGGAPPTGKPSANNDQDGREFIAPGAPATTPDAVQTREALSPAGSAEVPVWVVQIMSFGPEADARALADKLKARGYNVSILSPEATGEARHRVEIGPLQRRSEAQAVQRELALVHRLDQTVILTRPANSTAGVQPR